MSLVQRPNHSLHGEAVGHPVHPAALGDADHCAGCGSFIPRDQDRFIAILGSENGGKVLITRFCTAGCAQTWGAK
jgi:hypothetical protein